MHFDESIYDDPLWFCNEDIFYRTHPLIHPKLVEQIEKQIVNYQTNELNIRYNFLQFSYSKRIRNAIIN